jgi:NAD(P)-dependent dehydrogenase (short-subunit alcohol dehydrogenase family)
MMSLNNQHVVIICGTSGIGLATAKLAYSLHAKLTITGHTEKSLLEAKNHLGVNTQYDLLDIGNEDEVKRFFDKVDRIDHLVTPGNVLYTGPFLSFPVEKARIGMDSKFWGQYYAAKYAAPKIPSSGSIVLFSGIAAKRPTPGSTLMTAVNSAVEGLGRALAVELSPIRVNVISPGIIDTPRWAHMNDIERKAFYEKISNRLLVKKVGQADELAAAVLFLMTNGFISGETLEVSGGHILT